MLYKEDDLINLEADEVKGIKSWRFTDGGSTARAIGSGGHGGGKRSVIIVPVWRL